MEAVGFAADMIVVRALNEHDVLVEWNDAPYLMWVESTVGLTSEEIFSAPVFVAGTATVRVDRGGTLSLTVFQAVPEPQLRAAVHAQSAALGGEKSVAVPSPEGGFRVWNDRTGRFSVEAILLSSDESHAQLKKRDGSLITVPIAALSEADLK